MRGSIIRRVIGIVAIVVLVVAGYLCFWPVPVEPVAWAAPVPTRFTGAHAPNTRLSGLRTIDTRSEVGPEHIAIGTYDLMRGRDGRIRVGLFKPRNPAADGLAEKPFIRKVILRLPRSLLPLGESYSHVFVIDEDGRVTEDMQDPSGAYPEATSATETADRL